MVECRLRREKRQEVRGDVTAPPFRWPFTLASYLLLSLFRHLTRRKTPRRPVDQTIVEAGHLKMDGRHHSVEISEMRDDVLWRAKTK